MALPPGGQPGVSAQGLLAVLWEEERVATTTVNYLTTTIQSWMNSQLTWALKLSYVDLTKSEREKKR